MWCHAFVHFNHYGGSAAQLATALINLCREPGGRQDLVRLRAVLHEHGIVSGPLSAEQGAELAEWADQLRPVYGETDQERQIHIVNVLLERGASRPFVSRHGGRAPHLHYFPEDPDAVTRVRAQTAAGLAHVVCEAGGGRLGRCDRDDCETVFLDTSRNGRRRFCSLRCANRVRVADHRARGA